MDIKGKIIIFPQFIQKEGREPFKVFSTSVSEKDINGGYVSARLEVKFTKDFSKEFLDNLHVDKCYTFDLSKAWLSCRSWTDSSGHENKVLVLIIKTAYLIDEKEIVGKDIRETERDVGELPF